MLTVSAGTPLEMRRPQRHRDSAAGLLAKHEEPGALADAEPFSCICTLILLCCEGEALSAWGIFYMLRCMAHAGGSHAGG